MQLIIPHWDLQISQGDKVVMCKINMKSFSEADQILLSDFTWVVILSPSQATFEKLENELREVNANAETLKKNSLELTELKHVLSITQLFFDEVSLLPPTANIGGQALRLALVGHISLGHIRDQAQVKWTSKVEESWGES